MVDTDTICNGSSIRLGMHTRPTAKAVIKQDAEEFLLHNVCVRLHLPVLRIKIGPVLHTLMQISLMSDCQHFIRLAKYWTLQ